MSMGLGLFRLPAAISLLSPAGTLFTLVPAVPILVDGRFLPQFMYAHLRSRTGTATTGPSFKIGTNAAHDNIAPTFTVPTATGVGVIASLPLATPVKAVLIETASIILEIVTAAVGPSEMTGDLLIEGLLIG